MAEKVEVVIKIPKHYLTHPQDYTCLAECVRRGTVLPEHHGRLIDENDLPKCCGSKCCGSPEHDCYVECENCSDYVVHVDDIKKAPTIIEADKESEE